MAVLHARPSWKKSGLENTMTRWQESARKECEFHNSRKISNNIKIFKSPKSPANPNNDGSPSDSATVLIEVCCKGYKPYEYDTKKCIPDCPYGCENGFCVSPNVCNCFEDHIRSHDDRCVPTCPISCLNGVCDSNGICTCHPRHILDPFRKFCLPICHGSCGLNRYCSSPGRCSCIRGFKENLETGECDPICPLNCLNGRCISPGICACNPGYRLQDDVCQANCTRSLWIQKSVSTQIFRFSYF